MEFKRDISSLIVVLALVTGAWAAQRGNAPQAPASPSNTRSASCVVNITVDPGIVLLTPRSVESLVRSSAVAGKAAREVLSVAEDREKKPSYVIDVEWLVDSPHPIAGQPGHDPDAEPKSALTRKGGAPVSRTPPNADLNKTVQQNATLNLIVTLREGTQPAAEEFLRAIVKNLRESLDDAYSQYLVQNARLVEKAREQRADVQRELEHMMGLQPDSRAAGQLNRTVDLSSLEPETPLAEAIDRLQKAVDPPLNITVLWRSLDEEQGVTPDTEIQMKGPARAGVKTVLELLLKAVTPSAGGPPITYRCEGEVIVIGTATMLGGTPTTADGLAVPPEVLKSRRYELDNEIQQVELNMATAEARRRAIEVQTVQLRQQAAKIANDDMVSRELQGLVLANEARLRELEKAAAAGTISNADLAQVKESLVRARIDWAKRRDELAKTSGGGQLDTYADQISEMAIQTAQDKAKRDILRQRLAEVQQQLMQASAADSGARQTGSIQDSINALDQRINDLRTRRMNAQPPTVTVIGAN